MAHINVDNRILSNVYNDDLASILNKMIDDELAKSDDKIDTNYVNECVNALLELEKQDNNYAAVVPLISSEKFLKKILSRDSRKSFKSLNIFARTAVIAAIIAGGTFTANAAVEAVTGVNVFQSVSEKLNQTLVDLGILEDEFEGIENFDAGFDDDDEEETTTTTTTTQPSTEPTTEPTTKPTTTPSTTEEFEGIENFDAGFDDDDEEETTTTTTTTTQPTTEPTTRKPVPPTTAPPVTIPTTKNEDEVVFVGVEAEFDNFKTDYTYGEELTYEGLTLTEVFSDGSRKPLSLENCDYTKSVDMTKTADYTLRIIYKTSIIEIKITVRPDDDTRGGEVCSNDLYDYYLTDNGAYITAYRGDEQTINLDEVDGNPVFAIGEGVFKGKSVQSITAQNVKKIFPNSFKNCTELEEAYTPEAEYIGSNAFENCTNLGRALCSDSLYYLGDAVYRNSGIEEITIPELITKVPSALCEGCAELKKVNLAGRVTEIGHLAFSECTALEEVNGAESISIVKAFAFNEDELMVFDTAPTALEEVGNYAFAHCNKVNITKLGTELKSIGIGSFMYCYKLSEVEIDGSIEEIPNAAFQGAHIETLIISEGVRVINDYAFMSIMAKEIRLPSTITSIGNYSLYITFLRQIYFDKNIEEIADTAFYKSSRLTFYAYEGTVPYDYAQENSINCELLDD